MGVFRLGLLSLGHVRFDKVRFNWVVCLGEDKLDRLPPPEYPGK